MDCPDEGLEVSSGLWWTESLDLEGWEVELGSRGLTWLDL